MFRKFSVLVVLLTIFVFAAGCVIVEVMPNGAIEYKEYGEEIHSAFKYVIVDNSNGAVALEPSTDGKIKVQWEKRLQGVSEERLKEVAPEVEISIVEEGSTLRITTIIPQPRPAGVTSMGASYRLYVPVEILATIDTSNGSIQTNGIQQDINLKSSNGGITIYNHIGNIVARTSNGRISIDHAEGMIKADSSNGSISLLDVAGAVDVETSNSRVNIDTTRVITWADVKTTNGSIDFKGGVSPDGRYDLKTSNGSINIWLDTKFGYDLTANTSNGRINFDMPVLFSGNKENTSVNGQLYGGGIDLFLRTSNGNISLHEMGAQ